MVIPYESDVLYESEELLNIDLDSRPMLIPGVLASGDKIMCVAEPKVGKSLLAQQLASCVAGAHSFLGFPAADEPHRVLYIAGEGDIDELQFRGRAMRHRFPVPSDRLWYWPVPTVAMNTADGFSKLLEFSAKVEPELTIFDPIYALMKGSMKDDEPAGMFTQNLNRYQHLTGSAVIMLHHTHRPIRDQGGDTIDEGDNAYFGAFTWKAWARSFWLMKHDGPDLHYVQLSCLTQRNRTSEIGRLPMMMVEPDPLMFIPRPANRGPTQCIILEVLIDNPSTADELERRTLRSRSTLSEALTILTKQGIIVSDSKRPQRYSLAEAGL